MRNLSAMEEERDGSGKLTLRRIRCGVGVALGCLGIGEKVVR